jgi:hypothetical protein
MNPAEKPQPQASNSSKSNVDQKGSAEAAEAEDTIVCSVMMIIISLVYILAHNYKF